MDSPRFTQTWKYEQKTMFATHPVKLIMRGLLHIRGHT